MTNKLEIEEDKPATFEEVLALWIFQAIDPNRLIPYLLQIIQRQQVEQIT